jgi:O-antigen ligase
MRSDRLATTLAAVAAIGVAGVGGFALAMMGARVGNGPAVILGVPLLLLGALAVLRDPRFGVLAVFLIMPWGFTQVPGAPVQLIELVAAGAAVLVLIRRLGLGDAPLGWSAPLNWILALVLWVLLALPTAVDHDLAVSQTGQIVGGLLFMATVLAAITTARDVRRLMAVFVAVAALLAFTAVASGEQLQSQFGGGVVTGRATGIFSEPNQFGAMCSMAALVGVGLTLAARRFGMKLMGAAATIALVVGLLLSLSRGAWIGFTLGVLVLIVMLPRARRALLALSIPLVLLAVGLGAFAPGNPAVTVVSERLTATVSGSVRNPYDERPAIWAEAGREIVDSPITGQGPGGFPVAASRAGSETQTVTPDHAHNILLTWAAEAGIPAALMILGFAFHLGVKTHGVSRRLRPGTRDFDRATLTGLAAAAVSIAGQGIVDYVLRGPVVFYAAIAILGALMAMIRVARPAPTPAPAPREREPEDRRPAPERTPPEPEPEPILWRA